MLSNVMSTPILPPPSWSLFSTANFTRGFMLFSTSSKLSGVTSTNLRSLSRGSASAGLPLKSARTPIKKGQFLGLDRAARLHVIADVHARRTDALQFLLCSFSCHGGLPDAVCLRQSSAKREIMGWWRRAVKRIATFFRCFSDVQPGRGNKPTHSRNQDRQVAEAKQHVVHHPRQLLSRGTHAIHREISRREPPLGQLQQLRAVVATVEMSKNESLHS